MAHYPLLLDLSAKNALVVGAGAVGRRKIASLRKAAPRRVTVIDPAIDAAAEKALADIAGTSLECRARAFTPDDLNDQDIVFAATGDLALNTRIAVLCAGRGILCNCAAPPEAGSCIIPAHFESGGVTIAVSTGGQSPALARRLREELEALVGSRYTPLLLVMGRLRPLLLALGLPSRENSAVLNALVDSPLARHLEEKNLAAAEDVLRALVPEALHPRLGELLHGI